FSYHDQLIISTWMTFGQTRIMLVAIIASIFTKQVAYPLDVIHRRMQMVGWKHAGSVVIADGKSSFEYTGMVDAFRKTVRHEGFWALYKRLVPNSMKVVPLIAITFVSYEVVKDLLGVDMRISD
ncbi:mitochondrial adenine nucleotide transporter ADNT1-like protein, partial [Tanacetum coccineum]